MKGKMQDIPLLMDLKLQLEDEYYDTLEEQGVNFLEYEHSHDPDFTQTYIKPEYMLSHDEMARELGFDDFSDYCYEQTRQIVADRRKSYDDVSLFQVRRLFQEQQFIKEQTGLALDRS